MKRLMLVLFMMTAASAVSLAHAQQVFCKITGQKSGPIAGDTTIKGLEGTIPALALSEGVSSPRDPASGLPTGKRVHKPFVIVKQLDRASPLLFMAAVTNENLTSVDCSIYRRTGGRLPYFRIKLDNAVISSYDIHAREDGDNDRDIDTVRGASLGTHETIQFVFQRITLEDTVSGTVAQDDWEAPVQ
jgi:type VI secretion system secreted protein Hcp